MVAAAVQWETDDSFALPPTELLAVVLRQVLRPVTGKQLDAVVQMLVRIASTQHALLVEGEVAGHPAVNITLRSGMAYLQGALFQ